VTHLALDLGLSSIKVQGIKVQGHWLSSAGHSQLATSNLLHEHELVGLVQTMRHWRPYLW
jgi:hypothetical protein